MVLLKSINARPAIMGVLNLAPDSFSEVGRCLNQDHALRHVAAMIAEGVDLIDVGAEPTNPSQEHPVTSLQLELDRVVPVVEAIHANFDIPISVDTSKPEVMQAVIHAGASMINDVRALRLEGALQVVADANVQVCLMHMLYPFGVPADPTPDPYFGNIVEHIKQFFTETIALCTQAGIAKENILLDPGIGAGSFGKTTQQNLELLNRLPEFSTFGLALLIGVCRKTFIGDILNKPAAERLPGSLAAAIVAVANGANIIRVHDVAATVQALKIACAIWQQSNSLTVT